MRLETIQLSKLNPAEYNPRQITKEEFEGLKESLKTFGQQENLIVNKDMTIISGHQRYEAMKKLGWTEAVCNMVDLDKHQEKKLNVIMNSTAISGKYDDLKLSEILEELKLDDDYESLRLDKLEPLDLSDVEVEEDEAPEVSSEPPVSKLGDIYQLGRHRVMCGDSTKIEDVEKLMNGQKADMVFTDPPYGMGLEADFKWSKGNENMGIKPSKGYDQVIGDEKQFNYQEYEWLECKEQFWWGADYYVDTLPNCGKEGSWFVWDKKNDSLKDVWTNEFELLWSKVKHKKQVLRVLWNGALGTESEDVKNRVHPTQKPIRVCTPVIEQYSKNDDIVLDLFGGSGSTLIACEQTDRTCYGMELDEKYVDVIRKRYWKFVTGNEEGWEDGTTNSND